MDVENEAGEMQAPSVWVLESSHMPTGVGHILAPQQPKFGNLGLNLNAWNTLATASYQIDLRINRFSDNAHRNPMAIQSSLLISNKTSFKGIELKTVVKPL